VVNGDALRGPAGGLAGPCRAGVSTPGFDAAPYLSGRTLPSPMIPEDRREHHGHLPGRAQGERPGSACAWRRAIRRRPRRLSATGSSTQRKTPMTAARFVIGAATVVGVHRSAEARGGGGSDFRRGWRFAGALAGGRDPPPFNASLEWRRCRPTADSNRDRRG